MDQADTGEASLSERAIEASRCIYSLSQRQTSTTEMSRLQTLPEGSTENTCSEAQCHSETIYLPSATTQNSGTIVTKLKNSLKVKTKFIPAKATYFLFFAARSIFQANFMIFLTSLGLDPKQAGILQGIRLFLFTLSAFLWGYLTDRYNRQGLIISTQITMGTVFGIAMPLVPLFWSEIASESGLISGKTTLSWQNTTQTWLNVTESPAAELGVIQTIDKLHRTASTKVFLVMLGLGCGSAFFGGGTQVLVDSVILTFTKKASKSKNAFGRQRLWGSFSYAVCPVIVGAVTDSLNFKPSLYLPAFIINSVLNMSTLLSYMILVRTAKVSTASTYSLKDIRQKAKLWKSLKQSRVIAFLAVVFQLGFANGIYWNFLFIMTKDIGASQTFMGVLVLVQCLVEMVVLPSASKVRALFGGNNSAMVAGAFGYGAAFTVLYFIRDARLFLIVSVLIGISFSTFYTAAMDELYSLSSKESMTTFLGIYSALYSGVGSALAGVIGGTVYKVYGARLLFLSAAFLQYICGAFLVMWYVFDHHHNGKSRPSQQELKAANKKQMPGVIYSDVISVSIMSISIIELKALENTAMAADQIMEGQTPSTSDA